MEGLFFLGIIVVLVILVGAIWSFVNAGQISTLKQQVTQLKAHIAHQAKQLESLRDELTRSVANTLEQSSNSSQEKAQAPSPSTQDPQSSALGSEVEPAPPVSKSVPSASASKPVATQAMQANSRPVHAAKPPAHAKAKPNKASSPSFSLEQFLAGNGLLWIGAAVLALGGVFLAKYSIEAGLFPPQLRIILGAAFGIALVAAAEYLMRYPKRFQINSPVVSAALASGGVITLFAMTLVAFEFYEYLSPTFAFVLLAIISVGASWLSLRMGPILAAIGMIGAYAVPALVSTGSNNVLMLMLYVVAVSFSSVWVYQVVKREWLWWLSALGHFLWFAAVILLSIDASYDSSAVVQDLALENHIDYAEAAAFNYTYANAGVITAFGLLSLYLFTLFPVLSWKLSNTRYDALSTKEMLLPRKENLGLLLTLAGVFFYSLQLGFQPELIYMLIAFSIPMLIVPLRHSAFDSWPFIALIAALYVYLRMPVDYDYSDNMFVFTGGFLFIQTAVLIALVYAMFVQSVFKQRPAYLLLLVLAPLSLYSVAYALSESEAEQFLYPIFAIQLGLIALIFAALSVKSRVNIQKVAFLLLANGALTLIFTMLLSASTLTLALAVQLALMASLSKKYTLALPNWLYKLAVIAIMARLTFAPWLPDYAGEFILGLHWSIVIYPASFALLFFARKHLHAPDLRLWFDGALLHLIALFVTTETSYFLIGEYPNLNNLSFKQTALLGMNYIILSGMYLWRATLTDPSSKHRRLYYVFATLLIVGAGAMHVQASLIDNPFISTQSLGSNPLINWLVPLWLVPAISLAIIAKLKLVKMELSKALYIASAVFAVLYINSVIRLVFNDNMSLFVSDIGQAERYTYSIVYLLISVGLIVLAQKLSSQRVNRIGFVVLALVVLKAFVVDMANLEGLYRALSFIGLGLSLVGIGWLFQRFKHTSNEADSSAESEQSPT
ncbi:DUF2339 domain-containing protein [Ningiella sp. W23]|uniref:DUF2339 domain-containing protein n=1 Tax=Ningiella sp. W23 TaxID=3023715 RepID=UPI0037581132